MGGPVVIVKQGCLRGATVKSVVGKPYISFKGIPFAAPPIGNLRFADPKPPQPWRGIRDSYAEGPKCAQFNIFTKTIVGDDDCLYLNVATTSLTGSRPVMVWIHGGAFARGDGGSDMHSPDYLMEAEVVHVGFNYRVGVLGFLQLDHEAATGNMGLKDQVAALKWVKENISQFGGDPNNITVFGVSAGSASIHLLLLSPLAKGLFHKAIMQSGAATDSWARVSEPVEIARRYVAALGKDITDPNEIVEYLRTVPAHKLVEVQEQMVNSEVGIGNPQDRLKITLSFGPTIDVKSAEPFLPEPLEELVKQGFKVPAIIGYNSHEGAMFLLGLPDEGYIQLDENFEMTVPEELASKAPEKVAEIAGELRKFYFGDNLITKDLVENFVRYYGDLYFVIGIHKAVEIQLAKKTPTYFYRFSYGSPNSIAKTLFRVQVKGAMHTEELQYIFFQSLFREHIKIEPGSTEEILRQRFVRMWTDFAKTGNPTPLIDDLITEKWEPVTKTTKNYLNIDAELSTGVNPDEDSRQMWKRIDAMIIGKE